MLNTATGAYLNARVTVSGTNLVTFTNEFGEYRLTGVPAGTAQVVVTYTGMESTTASVNVAPGAVATHDFTLARPGSAASQAVVTLDPSRCSRSGR